MSDPRFVVTNDALHGETAVLTGTELHHLHVRRLGPGRKVILTDGRGNERAGVIATVDRERAIIDLSAAVRMTVPVLQLTLAQALLKGSKLDTVIEKSTELGVTSLVLFSSERTVARPTSDRRERWERIARSAAKQCQRSVVPKIEGPVSFETLLAPRRPELALMFWEEIASNSLRTVHMQWPRIGELMAVVGPEGGFSPAEAARGAAAGFHLIGLGSRVLRAETAALVAVTLCQFLWGDLARDPASP